MLLGCLHGISTVKVLNIGTDRSEKNSVDQAELQIRGGINDSS